MSQSPSAPLVSAKEEAIQEAAAGAPAGARAGIDNIQVLRAVAALLVVFVHLDVFLRALAIEPFGHGGVDLFFVISGFIMVYTTRARPLTPAAFMLNRVTRIAPIYWLITLAVYSVALVAPSLLQATSSDPVQLGKSLLFIPFQKSNGLVQPVLFVGWTLNYEMFFYALFAFGLMFRPLALGAAVVVGLLGALVIGGLVVRPEGPVAGFYTRPILLEFAAGMALGTLGSQVKIQTAWGRALLVALCLVGLAATAFVPLVWPEASRVITQGIPSVLVVASAVLLHQSGVQLAGSGRAKRALLLLGNASYSLYLTHPFVTQAAQKLGKRLGLSPLVVVPSMLVTLALVCAVGIITHLLIERPLTRLAKGLADRWLVRSTPPEPAPQYVRVD
jgi:exopolysaccharide production protein ExoZ